MLIGPSGSGKTTLLRCLNHLERVDRGRPLINGHLIGYRENGRGELREDSEAEIARQRREIGFVFQQFNLFPHLTVLQNSRSRRCGCARSRAQAPTRPARLLDRVGLARQGRRLPAASCPAASSSGSPSRARWRCSRG